MRIRYFQTAWDDIRNSEGWFGKLCILALVSLIPIFGQIVVLGYLYGWAREIAWGVHEPLPAKIFGNEDGKLYRRGWFVLVVSAVFAIVPAIVMGVGSSMQQAGYYGLMADAGGSSSTAATLVGSIVYLVGIAGLVLCSLLAWVGSMRVSIYDRLASGFQLGVIWKMFRHDMGGIARIFGMNLLVGLVLGIILSIVFSVLMLAVIFAGVGGLMGAGYSFDSLEYMSDAQAARFFVQFVVSAGLVGLVCLLAGAFVSGLSSVFVDLLVARALGYWTAQFDVPHWRGQNDPLPFESQNPFTQAMDAFSIEGSAYPEKGFEQQVAAESRED